MVSFYLFGDVTSVVLGGELRDGPWHIDHLQKQKLVPLRLSVATFDFHLGHHLSLRRSAG
jgi:hypothetical protein